MRKAFLLFLLLACSAAAQPRRQQPPRLVVGIVVDQMRYDYLQRFDPLFGNNGFRRLLHDGFSFTHARFNFQPTVTAVGHATIYTGAVPAVHGIPENNYYDRQAGKVVYVAEDPNVLPVGADAPARSASPFRLRSSTITDELKLSHPAAKVISIGIKDRSAVLPAGHIADGAYYFDEHSGNWITSTWYADRLPDWLDAWNKSRRVHQYVSSPWNLLLPRPAYTMTTGDTSAFERPLRPNSWPVFPYTLGIGDWKMLTATPFGNTMTKDLAIEALRREQMGRDEVTDFLCISFSSPDIIGHAFGIHSLEMADCYARLDRDLADLLQTLDREIGRKNVLIFLTSDHGAATNPLMAEELQLPGGRMQAELWLQAANRYLEERLRAPHLVDALIEQQLYLNDSALAASGIAYEQAAAVAAEFLLQQPGVLCTVAPRAGRSTCPPHTETFIRNGWVADRSGDVIFALQPGWIDWPYAQGTTHLTAHPYDQHMPLIWYGWNVRRGHTNEPVFLTDIAPTLSHLLQVPYPSGCQGKPLALPLKH
ncbi:MAG: alkaline phosphatase family protein [Chitinophagales bacterium]|nr:alkaline phosphatase family protein [Chitinophagales bacterium]